MCEFSEGGDMGRDVYKRQVFKAKSCYKIGLI